MAVTTDELLSLSRKKNRDVTLTGHPHSVKIELPVMLPAGELIRLYQTIKNALPEQSSHVIQFASAYSGEGTHMIAFEAAIVAATQIGLRVLFIDTALEPKGLRSELAIALNKPLSALLQHGGPLNDAQVSVYGTSLVYTALRRREYGFVLADLEIMDELLNIWRKTYDLIIVSSPAILTDVLCPALSKLADGSIIIVQAGRARSPVVAQTKHIIVSNGGKVIGAILNKRRFYIPRWLYRWL